MSVSLTLSVCVPVCLPTLPCLSVFLYVCLLTLPCLSACLAAYSALSVYLCLSVPVCLIPSCSCLLPVFSPSHPFLFCLSSFSQLSFLGLSYKQSAKWKRERERTQTHMHAEG